MEEEWIKERTVVFMKDSFRCAEFAPSEILDAASILSES